MRAVRSSHLVLALLLASPLAGAQDLALYDDFKHKRVDPQKWEGGLMKSGATEAARRVDGNGLRLDLHGYSDTSKNTGYTKVRNSMYLPEDVAAKVSTIEVEAGVREAVVQSCDANEGSSKVRFRLVGYWFSTGSSMKPKDRTGNVWAQIWIRGKNRTPALRSTSLRETKSFEVAANVYECANADCSRGKNLFTQKFDTAKPGEKKKLAITWDALSNKFVFKSDRAVVKYDYSTDLVNAGAPNYAHFKGVQVATDIQNCKVSRNHKWHRPSGHISAKVDKVRLNADYKRNW